MTSKYTALLFSSGSVLPTVLFETNSEAVLDRLLENLTTTLESAKVAEPITNADSWVVEKVDREVFAKRHPDIEPPVVGEIFPSAIAVSLRLGEKSYALTQKITTDKRAYDRTGEHPDNLQRGEVILHGISLYNLSTPD